MRARRERLVEPPRPFLFAVTYRRKYWLRCDHCFGSITHRHSLQGCAYAHWSSNTYARNLLRMRLGGFNPRRRGYRWTPGPECHAIFSSAGLSYLVDWLSSKRCNILSVVHNKDLWAQVGCQMSRRGLFSNYIFLDEGGSVDQKAVWQLSRDRERWPSPTGDTPLRVSVINVLGVWICPLFACPGRL